MFCYGLQAGCIELKIEKYYNMQKNIYSQALFLYNTRRKININIIKKGEVPYVSE